MRFNSIEDLNPAMRAQAEAALAAQPARRPLEGPECHSQPLETPKASVGRKNKFGAHRTFYDGVWFDSKGESERWAELRLLEKAGEIKNLSRQVGYAFQVNGVYIGEYKADFVYWEKLTNKEGWVTEDFKSTITSKNPMYRIKKKLMLALYNIDIRETQKEKL